MFKFGFWPRSNGDKMLSPFHPDTLFILVWGEIICSLNNKSLGWGYISLLYFSYPYELLIDI